jgi:Tol biopolymer transport system component
MDRDRWKKVERLYHEALALPAVERRAFLKEACEADSDLQREVESLVEETSAASGFLSDPAIVAAARLMVDKYGTLIGRQIGIYRLVSLLGAGGMGEVYRARDTKLGRDVAIKILPRAFTSDRERLARFEREARILATLNHPHIGAIYGVEDTEDLRALVLELVEGDTLADLLHPGPLPVAHALAMARQIVDALDAAHEKGIVHRDLKPANIKVTPDGVVKVLDFGLAKAATGDGSPRDLSRSPMETIGPTRDGIILGTVAYMSPEQARGKVVDKRTDVWAFGCVLYEMLAGHAAFRGETISDTIAAILEHEPAWDALPAATSTAVRRLLRRCLEPDPKRRLRDIGDAQIDLEDGSVAGLNQHAVGSVTSANRAHRRERLAWAMAGVLGVALATTIFFERRFGERPPEMAVTRLNISPPEKNQFDRATTPAVSPDGKQVVFGAIADNKTSQLWLRSLDSLTARPLAGTENAIYPFWSPDNKSVGFFAAGKLKRISISGGPATTLADASQGRGGTWSPDGVIVFAPTIYSGLYQVAASGGVVRPATRFDAGTPPQRFPWFLPDGRHFLYLFGAGGRDPQTIQIGSLDSLGETRNLLGGVDSGAMYAQGNLLFTRGTTLVARPFDVNRLALGGEEVPVADRVRGVRLQSWAFSVSANGVLVYASDRPNVLNLTWLDRSGKRVGTVGDPGNLRVVQLSPDRKTVAVVVGEAASGDQDIWLYDVLRGMRTRFTFGPAPHGSPVWSPDGRTLVFRSNRTGRFNLFRRMVDGSRNEELLYSDNSLKDPTGLSPDGTSLAYWVFGDPKMGDDIWILPRPLEAPGASEPYPFMRTEFNEQVPVFAPDGHWIAYRSNESGRYEVYVAPFPPTGGKRQVSISGAGSSLPRWRSDGKELFYVAADNSLMAAAVEPKGGAFEVKKVGALFGPVVGSYDVSADGQRFLTLVPIGNEADSPLTIVQNWPAALKNGR